MSTSEPFDINTIVSLWTQLFQLQVDIGYYEHDDAISFPPPEGRKVNETLCQELRLTEDVIALLRRLPCPKDFNNVAWERPVMYESFAVPFTEDEWIRESRDVERYNCADDYAPLRLDFLKPEELALVLAKDEPGYHLILDTKANTARIFISTAVAFNSYDDDKDEFERPDDPCYYRNHPARPAVEVLGELVAKFRDLEWIPVRYKGQFLDILAVRDDTSEFCPPNAYTDAKTILREEFGWPENFNKEEWNRQREEIWKRLLVSDEPQRQSTPSI